MQHCPSYQTHLHIICISRAEGTKISTLLRQIQGGAAAHSLFTSLPSTQ